VRYTMTVYGYNGQSATCQTSTYTPPPPPVYHPPVVHTPPVYVSPTPPVYVPPVVQNIVTTSAPYLALTQIPYTGFGDPVTDAAFSFSIMSIAGFGAFMLARQRGNGMTLALAQMRGRFGEVSRTIDRALTSASRRRDIDDEEDSADTLALVARERTE